MVSVAMAMECCTKCLRLAVSFLEDRNSENGFSRKSENNWFEFGKKISFFVQTIAKLFFVERHLLLFFDICKCQIENTLKFLCTLYVDNL